MISLLLINEFLYSYTLLSYLSFVSYTANYHLISFLTLKIFQQDFQNFLFHVPNANSIELNKLKTKLFSKVAPLLSGEPGLISIDSISYLKNEFYY